MHGRANPLMDRKVVGVAFFGLVAVAPSPTTAGCSAVVVVVAVKWNGVIVAVAV